MECAFPVLISDVAYLWPSGGTGSQGTGLTFFAIILSLATQTSGGKRFSFSFYAALKFWPVAIIAQITRALLFANATAARLCPRVAFF